MVCHFVTYLCRVVILKKFFEKEIKRGDALPSSCLRRAFALGPLPKAVKGRGQGGIALND